MRKPLQTKCHSHPKCRLPAASPGSWRRRACLLILLENPSGLLVQLPDARQRLLLRDGAIRRSEHDGADAVLDGIQGAFELQDTQTFLALNVERDRPQAKEG